MKTTALRGQLCGANPAGPLTPLTMLRLALYTACRGVKTPRKAVYSHIFLSKDGRRSAHGAFLPAQCASKAKQALFGVFWGVYPGKGPGFGLFWPILRPFLASTWPPAGAFRGVLTPRQAVYSASQSVVSGVSGPAGLAPQGWPRRAVVFIVTGHAVLV